jgi:hypothetical protein
VLVHLDDAAGRWRPGTGTAQAAPVDADRDAEPGAVAVAVKRLKTILESR